MSSIMPLGREPALHASVRNGIRPDVERILERGVSVNARNRNGESALVIAVKGSKKDIARILLHHGADPWRLHKRSGKTSLHIAAKRSDVDMLNILLNEEVGSSKNICSMLKKSCFPARKSCDINTQETFGGNTVLHFAVIRRDPSIVATLLKHVGAGINIKNKRGMTPLHIAAFYNSLNIVKLLLNGGEDSNSYCYASAEGFDTFRETYVADVAATDKYGRTPLHLTTDGDVAAYLLKKGAPIDSQDNEGCTALQQALHQQCPDSYVFEVLLFAGASLDIPDVTGQRSWRLIENRLEENDPNIVDVLLKFKVANVKKNITDRFDLSKLVRPHRLIKALRAELKKARNTVMGGVSFYTILTNTKGRKVSILKKKIINTIHGDDLQNKFPYYYHLIRMSFGETEKLRYLFDEVSEEFSIVLSSVLSLNIPEDISRLIITELIERDMNNLKNALL